MAEALGITVVPLTVFFEDEEYLDNVDLDNASFYKKLQESKSLPRTSQPPPAKFQTAYLQLMEEGADGILSVHLSSKLSGTYQSALTARNTLPEEERKVPIEVVASESISAGMFLGLQKAVAEAQKGLGVEEIKDHIEEQFARTRIFAALDTLTYLHRGGRIGGARAFLGNMLSVKPIVSLKEGAVIAVEQPRTRSKAFARLIQLALDSGPIEQIAIAESNEEVGAQLAETVKAAYKGNVARYKLGAVLGTHTGPGTVALVVVNAKIDGANH